MKSVATILLGILASVACRSRPATELRNSNPIYSRSDVTQELNQNGVQLGASADDVQKFFRSHPKYEICNDMSGGLIAVVRNRRVDPEADDQYVVIAYREGKVTNVDIGPPQFSAGNVATYCH